MKFQSTHPLRGATPTSSGPASRAIFQSTHPLRGATRAHVGVYLVDIAFQSTHPLRGATLSAADVDTGVLISIHAPLAGCDSAISAMPSASPRFQSTHPLRGATVAIGMELGMSTHFNPRTPCGVRHHPDQYRRPDKPISIHAPLAGCDAAGSWAHRTRA